MKSIRSTLGLLAIVIAGHIAIVQAQDALPSWNDGAAKQAIVNFVQTTTDSGSTNFVPTGERIATFDQDGTLWVERPVYSQLMFCFDRISAVVAAKRELKMSSRSRPLSPTTAKPSRNSRCGIWKKLRW